MSSRLFVAGMERALQGLQGQLIKTPFFSRLINQSLCLSPCQETFEYYQSQVYDYGDTFQDTFQDTFVNPEPISVVRLSLL